MRSLILQFPSEEFLKTENLDMVLLRKVKKLEFLQILERGPSTVGAIIRLLINEETTDIEDYMKLLNGNILKVEVLGREKDGAYILFTKYKICSKLLKRIFISTGVYAAFPNIEEGTIKLTLFGNVDQLYSALKDLENWKMHFKVISLTKAKFSSDSPLNALTEKQRRVLINAYELGYYDLPRRINSEGLAKKLNIARATFVVHRRKAERNILTEIIHDEGALQFSVSHHRLNKRNHSLQTIVA